MNIPYKVFPDGHGGHIYSVAAPVSVSLPVPNAPRTKRFEAIIDSGATRCLFHADVARLIGLDPQAGTREQTTGIGGRSDCYLHDIKLFVPGGAVIAKVAFKEDLPVTGLLGMNGFFEHFVVTFDGVANICRLDRMHRA